MIPTSRMVTILGLTSAGQDSNLYRGPGNESINNLFANQRPSIAIQYRGDHAESVEGPQAYQQIQIDIYDADGQLTSAIAKRPLDFLRHAGIYAADTTLDAGGIVGLELRVTVTHPTMGVSRVRLHQCYVTDIQYQVSTEGNKYVATVENRGTVTVS